MEGVPEETKRHVRDLTDAALIGLVKRDAAGYRPEVIAFAQAELDRRGLTHASVRAARPSAWSAVRKSVALSDDQYLVLWLGRLIRIAGLGGFAAFVRATGLSAVVGMVVSVMVYIAGRTIFDWWPFSLPTQQPPDPPQR